MDTDESREISGRSFKSNFGRAMLLHCLDMGGAAEIVSKL
jgi:hypothetical protein